MVHKSSPSKRPPQALIADAVLRGLRRALAPIKRSALFYAAILFPVAGAILSIFLMGDRLIIARFGGLGGSLIELGGCVVMIAVLIGLRGAASR